MSKPPKQPQMPPSIRTPWRLTDEAMRHMEALGVDAREVLAVLEKPQIAPYVTEPGITRRHGYGLRVDVQGARIVRVSVDGAHGGNWEELALARAKYGAGSNVPKLLSDEDEVSADEIKASESVFVGSKFTRRMPMVIPKAAPVNTTHVIDSIHPALRKSVVEAVEGDFSRLVVHSPTNVEVLPLPRDSKTRPHR